MTGGAGFIGSHIVDKLLSLGRDVVVIDNFSSGKKENLAQHLGNPKLEICNMSICENLHDVFKNVQVVLHLAALPLVQYSIAHPKEAHDVNNTGTLNVLINARDAGVKRVVFVSSASIYGDQEKLPFTEDMLPKPMSPYAAHKIMGEYYCKLFYQLYGLETVCLRYFNVYGPRHDPSSSYACLIPRSIDRVLKGQPIAVFGDGNQTRDFVYVGDIADATLAAAFSTSTSCLGESINISSARQTSVNEIAKNILSLHPGKIDYLPAVKEPRHNVADNTKAKNLLGWTPRVQLKEGLALTFAFFRSKNSSDKE